MNKRNIKIASISLSLLILVLLVVYADPQKFLTLVINSNYALLLAAFIVSNLNLSLRVAKWKVLLNDVKFTALVPVQLLGVTISNFSPGKIAEPVKSVILKMVTGKPVSSTLYSVVWERVIDVIVLLLLAAFGVSYLRLGGNWFFVSLISFVIFAALIVVALLFLWKENFRNFVLKILKKLPILNRISENFIEVFVKSSIKRSRLFYSFAITLVAWVIEGFVMHLVLLSIGVNVQPFLLAGIFALATIIGVSTALPGGIGSTDAVMVFFLSVLGVGQSLAVTGVLLSRFVTIWYASFLGGVSLIYLTRKSKIDYGSIFS